MSWINKRELQGLRDIAKRHLEDSMKRYEEDQKKEADAYAVRKWKSAGDPENGVETLDVPGGTLFRVRNQITFIGTSSSYWNGSSSAFAPGQIVRLG